MLILQLHEPNRIATAEYKGSARFARWIRTLLPAINDATIVDRLMGELGAKG
jgi:hypothetical protein